MPRGPARAVPAEPAERRARGRAGDVRAGLRLGRGLDAAACRPARRPTTCSTARKTWITNGPDADVLVVYAQDRCRRRSARYHAPSSSSAICAASAARRSSTSSACAARAPASWCSRTASCRRPTSSGTENGGVRVLMSGLDYERVVLAGGPLGLLAAALDLVLPYIRERRQFGQPIGTFELMQGKIADMYAALNASRAYVYAVARACDAGARDAARMRPPASCSPPSAPPRQHSRPSRRSAATATSTTSGRPAAARRQALRDRRRHPGDPPHADRPRAVRGARRASQFAQIPFEPAYRKVAAAIGARILGRTLRDGERLPSETELARQFGVNRSTVREALRGAPRAAACSSAAPGSKLMSVSRPPPRASQPGVSHALLSPRCHGARRMGGTDHP